jgi:2-keto-4-pentenoate hydratase/2-oxohepta-3-ene-1,7-dioic acid hydratase in catechol pathway
MLTYTHQPKKELDMVTHKKHVFIDGDAITAIQSRLQRGEPKCSIAQSFGISTSTVTNFDPNSKNYRPDLVRIRKNSSAKFVKNGSTVSDNTGKTAVVVNDNTGKISDKAKEYIDACCIVFDKSRRQIMDEMVKACKALGACNVHDGK